MTTIISLITEFILKQYGIDADLLKEALEKIGGKKSVNKNNEGQEILDTIDAVQKQLEESKNTIDKSLEQIEKQKELFEQMKKEAEMNKQLSSLTEGQAKAVKDCFGHEIREENKKITLKDIKLCVISGMVGTVIGMFCSYIRLRYFSS